MSYQAGFYSCNCILFISRCIVSLISVFLLKSNSNIGVVELLLIRSGGLGEKQKKNIQTFVSIYGNQWKLH